MEKLIIEGSEDTPRVMFDPVANSYHISGRSLPEDVLTFFDPVMKWVDAFGGSTLPSLKLTVDLEYFNTASSKILLDIFMKLEDAITQGKEVAVIWIYTSVDVDMQEAGAEYAEIVSVPFEMVAKDKAA
jgi:SiaC family regulatory phosphoprotein